MKKLLLNSVLAVLLLLNVFSPQAFASCGYCNKGKSHHYEMKQKMDAMFTEIGVDCNQKQQIDAIMQNSRAQSKPIRKCMREKKKALMQYIMTPQATKEQALCLESEISQLHSQLHTIHINTMFEIKKILTPCQQQKMCDYHQKHMAEFEKKHACPME
jgi:Spy/CpxP family protein refolding chaperone